MISYFYNEKTDVLEVRVEGIIKIDVILDHYNTIFNNDSLPRDLKARIDCRKAVFDVHPLSLKPTYNLIKNNIHKFHSVKEAILVESSTGAAIATLFKRLNSNIKNYSFRIFNTDEASKDWLLE